MPGGGGSSSDSGGSGKGRQDAESQYGADSYGSYDSSQNTSNRGGNNINRGGNNINKNLKNVLSLNASNITKPELFFNQNLPFNIADLKGKIFMDDILDNDNIQLDSQFSTNLLPNFNTTTKITEQGIGPTTLSYNDITALIDQNKNLQNIQYNKGPFSVGYSGDGNYNLGFSLNYANGGIVSLL